MEHKNIGRSKIGTLKIEQRSSFLVLKWPFEAINIQLLPSFISKVFWSHTQPCLLNEKKWLSTVTTFIHTPVGNSANKCKTEFLNWVLIVKYQTLNRHLDLSIIFSLPLHNTCSCYLGPYNFSIFPTIGPYHSCLYVFYC
jgi:hypothetical protein